jgi:hypothetical protein
VNDYAEDKDVHLDERFDFTPPRKLRRTHSLGHFPRIALDSNNNGVRIRALLGTIVDLLDDDDLPACLAALEDDGDLCAPKVKEWSVDEKEDRYLSWLVNFDKIRSGNRENKCRCVPLTILTFLKCELSCLHQFRG